MNAVRILNSRFDAVDLPQTVDFAIDAIRRGAKTYICTVNCAILMQMRSDPRLQRFVDRAGLVVADGQPIVWGSRMLRRPIPTRVAGVDLVQALVARAASDGIHVFFLGARQNVLDAVVDRFRSEHPELLVAGALDGYFDDHAAIERAKQISDSGAQLLIVGMGVPRQEYFLQDHLDRLDVRVAIGVGGSFDVLAGFRKRAPRLAQRMGLEWVYRLGQEPRRLWRRYLVTNTQFLYHMTREITSGLGRSNLQQR